MARRWSRTQSQILVWAGEEPLDIEYDAEVIRVPPRTEVAQVGQGRRYRYESATTRAGVPIPGTIVLSDVFRENDAGGHAKTFDVAAFCSFLEDQRQDLFNRGLDIVTDAADAPEVMKELVPKWEASQDERARLIITTELERRKKLEAKGEPVTPGSSEHLVIWAFSHLKNRQKVLRPALDTSDLYNVAAGVYDPKKVAGTAPTVSLSDGGAVYREAEELGISLNTGEMSGLLKSDPETMEFVKKKIATKREEKAAGL